ncbi:MAG: hypothetical protein AAGJ82_08590 [Bacteroidota bacterium]
MNTNPFFALSIVLVILLIGVQTTFGQDRKWQLGVDAQTLFQVASADPFRLSMGNRLGLWTERPVSQRSSIQVAASLRNLNGLQLRQNELFNAYLPQEFRRNINSTMLSSLRYVDLGLSWYYTPRRAGPWALGAGVYGAYLYTWRGARQTNTWVSGEQLRYSSNPSAGGFGISGGSSTRSLSSDPQPLARAAFQSFDFGLQFHLRYALSPGLQLQCSYLQGFRNLITPELFGQSSSFLASSFHLGISARIL